MYPPDEGLLGHRGHEATWGGHPQMMVAGDSDIGTPLPSHLSEPLGMSSSRNRAEESSK